MKHAWARWVLVVSNALLAMATSSFAFLVWRDDGRLHQVVGLLGLLALALGATAYWQRHRRGRFAQTFLAVVALGGSAWLRWWPAALYAAVALVIVWWLGDFGEPARSRPPSLTHTPENLARVMAEEGQSAETIRSALTARGVPPEEVEAIVSNSTDRGRAP
jgi:hypothetical protein